MLKVFSNWHYQIDTLLNVGGFFNRCVWPGMSKLPKITSLLFLYNILRKKWVMQLIFYMQISMTACYKLILRFFDGYGQAFPKFPKMNICNVFTISLKKVRDEVDFFDSDKHQSFLIVDFNILASKFSAVWQAWSWKREGHGDENVQAFSKYSKQQVCNVLTISIRRSYAWSSRFFM